jgi:hypothetical protein
MATSPLLWSKVTADRSRGTLLGQIFVLLFAMVGASVLLVIAVTRWRSSSDAFAYWLGAKRLVEGQLLYDPTANLTTPFAYLYPPPLAQALAPLTRVVSDVGYEFIWTAILLVILLWFARWRPILALALVAFLPVAVELWFRNVHLVLAALIVLALRWAPWLFAVGAAIKISPGLGIVYLAVRGRWRDAIVATLVGLGILVASVVVSPGAWNDFVRTVAAQGAGSGASIIPVPFFVRATAGLALTVVAARLPVRTGEPLLVVAITLANPTLYVTALSMLIAIVPLLRLPEEKTSATALGTVEPATT